MSLQVVLMHDHLVTLQTVCYLVYSLCDLSVSILTLWSVYVELPDRTFGCQYVVAYNFTPCCVFVGSPSLYLCCFNVVSSDLTP